MRLTAAEIATRAGGAVVTGDPNLLVTSWGFDSRALLPGACFVALKDHRDGHDFIGAAFRAGAHVALIDRDVPGSAAHGSGTLVKVPEVIAGLQAVARSVRAARADLRVVGVTGSTGKTSTKDLLAAALPDGAAYASPESYNNEFGLPLTLLNTPAGVRGVVAEMGERFPGDIALLCEIARPEFGIVTNVGLAHAEHLGGREGVASVLAELLEALPESGAAVLPADDEWTPWLAARTSARVETVGYDADAAHRISHVDVGRALRSGIHARRLPVPHRAPRCAPSDQRGDGCRDGARRVRGRARGRRRADGSGAWIALAHGARRVGRRRGGAQRRVQRQPGIDGRGAAGARAARCRRATDRGPR